MCKLSNKTVAQTYDIKYIIITSKLRKRLNKANTESKVDPSWTDYVQDGCKPHNEKYLTLMYYHSKWYTHQVKINSKNSLGTTDKKTHYQGLTSWLHTALVITCILDMLQFKLVKKKKKVGRSGFQKSKRIACSLFFPKQ